MNRVAIKPDLLRWARERAGRSVESLAGKFPKLERWERGEVKPTLKQLEQFAERSSDADAAIAAFEAWLRERVQPR